MYMKNCNYLSLQLSYYEFKYNVILKYSFELLCSLKNDSHAKFLVTKIVSFCDSIGDKFWFILKIFVLLHLQSTLCRNSTLFWLFFCRFLLAPWFVTSSTGSTCNLMLHQIAFYWSRKGYKQKQTWRIWDYLACVSQS